MAILLKKIILASKSVDRSNIFKHSGIIFEVLASDIDESEFKKKISNPILLVKELAKAKALDAKEKLVKKKSNFEAVCMTREEKQKASSAIGRTMKKIDKLEKKIEVENDN